MRKELGGRAPGPLFQAKGTRAGGLSGRQFPVAKAPRVRWHGAGRAGAKTQDEVRWAQPQRSGWGVGKTGSTPTAHQRLRSESIQDRWIPQK